MQWSKESYRLDKVKDKFDLPRVVRLTESYLPRNETEKFVSGDILILNKEIFLHKIGAYFIHWDSEDSAVPTSDNQEFFLPHSYDGKVHVMKRITTVNTVKELVDIFPGYAELGEKLTVKAHTGKTVKLDKGTKIELERVIPGSITGFVKEPDELVIQFEHSKKNKVAAIPFNKKGKFHTIADRKMYTIKTAIERYGLPLDVRFISNEIKQKFYAEVLTGHRKPGSVTASARLTRMVMQRALVGHHMPAIDAGNSARVPRESVVVIPIDNEEVGKLLVNVCESHVRTIYGSLVTERSATEACRVVKESLCLDFAVNPEMKRLPLAGSRVQCRRRQEPPVPENSDNSGDDDDDYLIPIPKRCTDELEGYVDMSVTELEGYVDMSVTELEGYVDMSGTSRSNAADPPLPPRRSAHTSPLPPWRSAHTSPLPPRRPAHTPHLH
ncbi:uncharacterized protein LOC132732534 isoform X3 [Ruditapes philippinarum]|uniref:uncharacterized protein LOC132732534 isoform X3 n=1 Tax=Ruditapes philippinarum TaxID=129788 RepID=UPI00295C1CA0|nr:uncharacterized protein LOC132732534 isoform X3 [Ruditapes philippinarum]